MSNTIKNNKNNLSNLDTESSKSPKGNASGIDESNESNTPVDYSKQYPVIPIRDLQSFPSMVTSILVGREKSIGAINQAISSDNKIITVMQRDYSKEDVTSKDLYDIGVINEIVQVIKLPNSNIRTLVNGIKTVKILSYKTINKVTYAQIEDYPDLEYTDKSTESSRDELLSLFDIYTANYKTANKSFTDSLSKIENSYVLGYSIIMKIDASREDKQLFLEQRSALERFTLISTIIESKLEVIKLEKKIKDTVRQKVEKHQKEYFLNEQMKVIQKELNGDGKDEIATLKDDVKKLKAPAKLKEKLHVEISRLAQMSSTSAEASVVRNYIEWVLALPWGPVKNKPVDLNKATDILNNSHYGLDKVKDKVLEYLAVQARVGKVKGSILCLVGPPGVGKTSLASYIAKAANRPFVRMSLGGVRDEAEIRGHRKTYIGAMPGKIIQMIRKVKAANPVILLDEIDKMGHDFRGDPAAALLEVLDQEQNHTFSDHYIEYEYDLSNVMFIATANSMDMHEALIDRMDVIRVPGYTEEEKLNIATQYIIPRLLKDSGTSKKEISIKDSAIKDIINKYTMESGVRSLSRELNNLIRKSLRKIVAGDVKSTSITNKNLPDYLGPNKITDTLVPSVDTVGNVIGLAWTSVGGDILNIESIMYKGTGKVKITGKIGDVMKESLDAAYSVVKNYLSSNAKDDNKFSKALKLLEESDIHVHVPEGATPKDGPSAGAAMASVIMSVVMNKKIKHHVSMTGEITLSGQILPIGGVKEKLLAALRYNMKQVIIPKSNEKDLHDMPDYAIKNLKIISVCTIEEVFDIIFE